MDNGERCPWLCLPESLEEDAERDSELAAQALAFRATMRHDITQCVTHLYGAALWSFGSALLRQYVGVAAETVRLLWPIAGSAGIVGAATGRVAARIGLNGVYRLSLCGMALLVLALRRGESIGLGIAVACYGAGDVTLSGVLLVWGARATAEDPATGVGILFFMQAAGQVVGSQLSGQLFACWGATTALSLFAIVALLLLCVAPAQNREEAVK